MSVREMMGDRTLAKLKSNRAWMLAQVLREILYESRVQDVQTTGSIAPRKMFLTSEFITEAVEAWFKSPAREGDNWNVKRVLHEIADELERRAVKDET